LKRKVSIIGTGNVGATLCLYLAQQELCDITLIDINKDVAYGKALDIMQAGAILGFGTNIVTGDDYSLVKDSDVVVVTAGFPRQPGMDRLDLLHKNRDIIDMSGEAIKKFAPNSIVIVVTNPVDVMTYRMWQVTGFSENRVMGQAGVLDTGRLIMFLSEELNISPKDIDGLVLGGHGDTMLPIFDLTRVKGIPVKALIKEDRLREIEKKTQNGGGQIVSLLKTSAYYAPATATFVMVKAILNDEKRVIAASCKPNGEYGLSDVYIGLPTIIGKNGIEEILKIELEEEDLKKLVESAKVYKNSISEL